MNVYLDSILLEHPPLGLENIEEVVELDLTLHGYVRFFELPLTFVGDGFTYLNNLKKTYGYCRKVPIRIEVPSDQGTNIANGYIFLTEGSFNHTTFKAEFEITDDTYGVFVSESKELKISPAATVTRGGETLTAVTATDVTLFTPSTGADLVTDAKMYELSAVAGHIIKYLSDNGLQFSQSYFTGSFLFYLSNHYRIYNRGVAPDVQFSFEEVMTALFKLFGIWFKIDNSTTPPTFTLVQGEANFFEAHGGITWNNIRDLVEEFYPERLFATVDVGDEDAIIERGTTYQLPTVPLVGFREETFNASSDCTLSNTLDLRSEWVIDHNKIESMILTGVYEERPVLIYVDSSANAHKGTYGIQGVRRYYNEELLNYKVLERHNLPSDVSQGLGADTDNFLAYKTNDTTSNADGSLINIDFDDDVPPHGFDTGGNYSTVAYRYVCPAQGSYKFQTTIEYIVNSLQDSGGSPVIPGKVEVEVNIVRKNSAGTVIQTVEVSNSVRLAPTGTVVVDTGSAQFFCEATDRIECELTWDFLFNGANNSITFKGLYFDPDGTPRGCRFESLFVFNNGGTADVTNLLDYRASALKFDGFPITANDWNSIKQNPSQGININNGGNNSLCWIKRIKRNLKTGKSSVEMISSPILTQL